MRPLLRNPVYQSLLLNDAHLGNRTGGVCWFDEDVSPFAGFDEANENGFEELHAALLAGRRILYATPRQVVPPPFWKVKAAIEGLQFVFEGGAIEENPTFRPARLQAEHIAQMLALAGLTKPGPFGPRTIEFGHYYGVFENGELAAMTGQRLHVQHFTEVSAVCTHPDHLGKGFASALVHHQVALILAQGQTPFLHVRADNLRAIDVYKRLGFIEQGPMNFYFLQKESSH